MEERNDKFRALFRSLQRDYGGLVAAAAVVFAVTFAVILGLLLLIAGEENRFEPASLNPNPRAIISTPAGETLSVEIAATPEQRRQGLMYRDSLESDGMLFVFPQAESPSFWMQNTYIPLDIIFIADDGRVTDIYEMAKPLDTEISYPATEEIIYTLEIKGGRAESLEIAEESILSIQLPTGITIR